ncbi:MAG: serine/threonine protein kinase, partial [Planctomycetes bacterium]|nr:serine/threonine protein kinase [Planctomycetota bacterium]
MPDDPLIGFQTDSVRFEQLLGKGAMGSVYRGIQLGLERTVAIKVIAPHLAGDSDYIERFGREAHTIGKLVHPNVIACHDFGPCKGPSGEQLYLMILEFVDGWSLGTLVKSKRTLVRQILEYHRQAAEGLHAAHQLGIVHRDIKPDNIMITKLGESKLADFGLARNLEGAHMTQAGAVLGSPAYMSPEACRGEDPTIASDIYSLGCSLFQTLTGYPTFEAASAIQVLQMHITAPIPQLATHRPDLEFLQPIIQKCLAKHPAHRYADAHALAKAIHAIGVHASRDLAAGKPAQAEIPAMLGDQATLLTNVPRGHSTVATQVPARAPISGRTAAASGRSSSASGRSSQSQSAAQSKQQSRRRRDWVGAGVAGAAVIAGLILFGMTGRASAQPAVPAPVDLRSILDSDGSRPAPESANDPAKREDAHLRDIDRSLDLVQAQITANDLGAAEKSLDTLVVSGDRLKVRKRQLKESLVARWSQQESALRQQLDDLEKSLARDPLAAVAKARQIEIPERFVDLGARRDALVARAVATSAQRTTAPNPMSSAPEPEAAPAPPTPQLIALKPGLNVMGTPIPLGHVMLPGRMPMGDFVSFAYSQSGETATNAESRMQLVIDVPKGSGSMGDGLVILLHSGTKDSRQVAVSIISAGSAECPLQPLQMAGSNWEFLRIPLPDATRGTRQIRLSAEGGARFFFCAGVFGFACMPNATDLAVAPGTLAQM